MAGHQVGAVSVKTAARVHLGFMDPSGQAARPFGSVGVTLDRPCTKVVAQRSAGLIVEGAEQTRVERFVRQLASYFGADVNVRVNVLEAIPAHAGLGSGTQLAIAVGTAYAAVQGIDSSPREIAVVLERGTRSGIGIGSFQTGGLLFDGGPGANGLVAPILSRIAFPKKWRIILVMDRAAMALHGEGELRAFQQLAPYPPEKVAALCRQTVMGLLPAVVEEDFDRFCENVGFIQDCMGQYFAPVQGGHFTSAQVGDVVGWAKQNGFAGVGQSSWGPTGVVFAASEDMARAFIAQAQAECPAAAAVTFMLASGSNDGALVENLQSFQTESGDEIGQPA